MIESLFTAGMFASSIRLATPYLYAGIGEMFGQRSGVLNLGVEGVMLMGAFTSFWAVNRFTPAVRQAGTGRRCCSGCWRRCWWGC